MSDRLLREPERAMAQRLTVMQRQLNRLNLHTWPGALRTATLDSTQTVGATSARVLLPLELSPGRWRVSMRGIIRIPSSSGGEILFARITTTSSTEENLPLWIWRVLHSASSLIVPFHDEGDFVTDEISTVRLEGWSDTSLTITWESLALRAHPV